MRKLISHRHAIVAVNITSMSYHIVWVWEAIIQGLTLLAQVHPLLLLHLFLHLMLLTS